MLTSSRYTPHPHSQRALVRIPSTSSRRRYAPAQVEQPKLFEFLILSMLIHVLVIVLFGNATGGAGRRGEEWWSQLDVILRRPSTGPGAGFRLAPGAETSAPGSALLPRPGTAPARPRVEPPPAAEPPAPESNRIEPAPEAAPRVQPPSVEPLPGLNPNAPEEVDKTFAPAAPLERVAPSKIERQLAPPLELTPREVPIAPAVPLERVAPPRIERQLAPPAELTPREMPITSAPPLERIAPPKIEPQLAPPVELAPREMPIAPAAPIERIAPPKLERQVEPPVELAPQELPIAPAAPIERIAPSKIEPQLAPPVEFPAPRRAPGEVLTPSERAAPKPGSEAPPATTPTPRGAPGATTPQAPAPERFHFGSPTPEEEIFRPRGNVMPPLDEPATPPYIDLEGARTQAAREIVREGAGSRAVLALPVPPPPERKSKEAQALEKAIKPDCRTEYAALGLFAVPALLISAIADTGCRW